jgi:hypothetical protein
MPICSKDQANPSSHITNAAAAEENQRNRQNLALEEYTMMVLTTSCSCPSGLWIIKCGIRHTIDQFFRMEYYEEKILTGTAQQGSSSSSQIQTVQKFL